MIPKSVVVAVAVLTALPISGSHLAAQDEEREHQVTIVGQVVDKETGAPVSGARVFVVDSEWMSVTNQEGRFVLYRLESGIHVVEVEQLGYRTLYAEAEAAVGSDLIQLAIEPDPFILEGLEVVTKRFERRRRALGIRVLEFDENDLATSTYSSASDMLTVRIPVQRTHCIDGEYECVYARGQVVRPSVYIDESPMIGGWGMLDIYHPQDFYMIEVYRQGAHIRAYTHSFMERASKIRFLPLPIW